MVQIKQIKLQGTSSKSQVFISHMVQIKTVIIRAEYIPHLVEKAEDARERYANYLIPALTNPYEIYLTEYEDGFRERYIGLFTGKTNLLVVVRLNKDGSLLWNIMQANDKDMNKQRIGALLYGK